MFDRQGKLINAYKIAGRRFSAAETYGYGCFAIKGSCWDS